MWPTIQSVGLCVRQLSASQRNRITASAPNTSAHTSSPVAGQIAAEKLKPRQVIPSRPSIAQRVGTNIVIVCSHCGKINAGTHAPPSITMIKVTRMERPRVASGVLPTAAISSPKAAVISEKATQTQRNPAGLPSNADAKHHAGKAKNYQQNQHRGNGRTDGPAAEQKTSRQRRGSQAFP
jgi:hypothetical protein